MKVYRLEVIVIDDENYGADEISLIIGNCRGLFPIVSKIEGREIGEWRDDHPLNLPATFKSAVDEIFKNE